MRRHLLALGLSAWASCAIAGYDAISARGTDLSGDWRLNAALSDDAERALKQQLDRERRRELQWQREQQRSQPDGVPSAQPGVLDEPVPATRRRAPRPWQVRRDENFRKLLAISPTLTIRQAGTSVEIVSAVESRRVEAGARTQVSMPESGLADSQVGWDGDWFVIERRVRRGPRVLEKFRLLKKTDQLEYVLAVSGDTELAGIKLKRIFDRVASVSPLPDPQAGPVR